ncbi:hypothetical protein GCM10028801_42950 [Nocardioides maradonensis]
MAERYGIPRHRLRSWLDDGVVRRLLTDVYVAAAHRDTVELRVAAAALVIDPGHVAVDRTAAYLHGVDAYVHAETAVLPPIETCALRGRHPTERSGIASGTRTLASTDVMVVGSIRVTTPLRTSLDLGCRLHARDAMACMNQFARDHGVDALALTAQLDRYRGRRGVRQLRQLVPYVDGRPESARESWVWLEICRSGLPRPVPQFWIEIGGRPTYRLDFAYPQHRVAVEYDGAHHLEPGQAGHDAERLAWLRAAGWTVIVVRAGDFTGRRLDDWLGRLRSALADHPTNLRW